MKAPAFWNRPPGILSALLAPFGLVYGRITAWRMMRAGTRVDIPVICIGNLTAGGAGKTPATALVAALLAGSGEKPFILSRGYGGQLAGPLQVDPLLHSSKDCGDEPLLLARDAPTIIAADRLAGARLARASGATVIVMDDGLQNPVLAKDFSIAVIDGGVGFGNGHCIPAGPLRAPVTLQLPRIDHVMVIGGKREGQGMPFLQDLQGKPVHFGKLAPSPDGLAALKGQPLLAFAGIGRPEKFFETLREHGLDLRQTRSFADHHAYSDADTEALRREASQKGLTLVTTEKDAVRITDLQDILILPVRLETENQPLLSALQVVISRKRSANQAPSGA